MSPIKNPCILKERLDALWVHTLHCRTDGGNHRHCVPPMGWKPTTFKLKFFAACARTGADVSIKRIDLVIQEALEFGVPDHEISDILHVDLP